MTGLRARASLSLVKHYVKLDILFEWTAFIVDRTGRRRPILKMSRFIESFKNQLADDLLDKYIKY